VFEKTKHRFSLRKWKLQGRFDGEALAEGVRRILRRRNIPENAMLKDPDSRCKTYVRASSIFVNRLTQ
jgi:hypothetical protein